MRTIKSTLITAVFLAGSAAGCSSGEGSSETHYQPPAAAIGDEATPPEPTTTAEPQFGPIAAPPATTAPPAPLPQTNEGDATAISLRDGQIIRITELVNAGEVEQAKLAKTKAKQPEVRQFAEDMITQHTQAKRQGAQLADETLLTAEESPVSSELEGKSAATLKQLKSAAPSGFDAMYMKAQVEQHQEALDMLTNKLLPSASSADLRRELESTRSMIQRHLGAAQAIQQRLPVDTE